MFKQTVVTLLFFILIFLSSNQRVELFHDALASAQEVKTVEDAVAIVIDHRWPQRFSLHGNTVFGLCVQEGKAILTCAVFEAQNPNSFPQLLRELREACAKRCGDHAPKLSAILSPPPAREETIDSE